MPKSSCARLALAARLSALLITMSATLSCAFRPAGASINELVWAVLGRLDEGCRTPSKRTSAAALLDRSRDDSPSRRVKRLAFGVLVILIASLCSACGASTGSSADGNPPAVATPPPSS